MATAAATITMTMREADRLKTVQAVVDRMLRVGQAAQRLGISRRQVERPMDRYVDEGPSGLVSRRRGRPSNSQLAPGVAGHAIAIIRERYADFGPTLAAEKLQECHGGRPQQGDCAGVDGVCGPVDTTRPRFISRATVAPAWAS